MARKKQSRRRRSTSEKIVIVLGIIIAISMILGMFVGFGAGGSTESSGSQGSLPTTDVVWASPAGAAPSPAAAWALPAPPA
jgi:hypothetical protein